MTSPPWPRPGPPGLRLPARPTPPGPRQRSRLLPWLTPAGALLLFGAGLTSVALSGSRPPLTPPAIGLGGPATFPAARGAGGRPRPAARCATAPAVTEPGLARPLPYSVPVQVAIPAICVTARVVPLGENQDGTVQVPSLSTPRLTSWFDAGPAPGQAGPAALYGHVYTAAAGPAVFYQVGDLGPGDAVDVTRADHRVAVFTVYRVAEYPKDEFPTMTVYGGTQAPELRLITCGGPFDTATGSYRDNIVVYARLTAATGT